MIIRKAQFLTAGLRPDQYPRTTLPEIAFAGRSNVGKSSLINTLAGRKSLVRTGRKPGQTRTLNFFLLNDCFLFVDLPGYGFSQAPKEMIRTYLDTMEDYLRHRTQLILVIVLLDIRRLPSPEDRSFYRFLKTVGRPLQIVLTKTDTVSPGQWKKSWQEIASALEAMEEEPVFFSSKTGRGKEALWPVIEKALTTNEKEKKEDS